MRKIFALVLSISICLISASSVFGIESSPASDLPYDSYRLGEGTVYSTFIDGQTVVFICYDDGRVEYSICERERGLIVQSGIFQLSTVLVSDCVRQHLNSSQLNSIYQNILNDNSAETTDYSSRIIRATIDSESDALDFAEQYVENWEDPVTNVIIGGGNSQGVSVSVRETINADVDQVCSFKYYENDLLSSILSIILSHVEDHGFRLTLSNLQNVISSIYSAGRYVVRYTDDFYAFMIDNSRTKTATISGDTYYWAGWDFDFLVYSGDDGTGYKKGRDLMHPDYLNSVSYFVQRAVDNYLSE